MSHLTAENFNQVPLGHDSLQSLPSRFQLLPVTLRRIPRPSPPGTAYWAPAGGVPVDTPRRQRSISLCQPHSTTPHPSRAGVPTRLLDALGCRPSTAGGQGPTLSTFPLVPLTREPTCTQAIDPGISRSTLTLADTSRPSRSSGHFPDFPWPGSPWLAHGSPLHGDRFPNPMGLLLGAFGLPALPMSHFLFATSRHRPVPCVPWTPYPVGPWCGPSHTPFPAPSPCPFIPCLYPTGSPATLWRWPTGASSFQGPLRALCTGRSLPGLILWAVLRPLPIPHPVFIPHRAASNPVARALWILIHPGTLSCA